MTPNYDLCDLYPQLTFDYLFPPVTQYHKTAHTVSPNELDQISLLWKSMALGTTFHVPHCQSNINGNRSDITGHIFKPEKWAWPLT